METELRIQTPDKHLIYGTLRTPAKTTQSLVILVHGLTGNRNEHIFYNGARFFAGKGIATFRFDFYPGEKKSRTLSTITLKQQAEDLNTVVRHFRKRFKKICVVGHSLGGPTILLSDTNAVDAIVLWDGSDRLTEREWKSFIRFNRHVGTYIVDWGVEYAISKALFHEWTEFPNHADIIRRIHRPIKFITADTGGNNRKGNRLYFKYAHEPKAFAIIKGASHCFNEDGAEEKLFQETYSFVKQFTS